MTTYNLAISKNPNFQTVNSLTNLVFDRNNVRSGRMATENQIQQLWQDIVRLEERIDYCCRDIVFWDFRIRIRDKHGNIVTDFLENRTTGITRRGKNFVMTLPIKAIPKYELNTQTSSYSAANHIDEDVNKCFKPDYTSADLITGLCNLLYRGTSGQYYNMSVRQTGKFFIGQQNQYSFFKKEVDVNGTEGTQGGFKVATHFASADTDGNISISVGEPINLWGGSTKSYGRIYYLDLRDVTLGS